MKVRYTDEAGAQLGDILAWLRRRNPRAAAEVAVRVDKLIVLLEQFPYLGQQRFEGGVRVLPVARYPYLIFYKVEGDEVEIISVRHASRRPPREADWT